MKKKHIAVALLATACSLASLGLIHADDDAAERDVVAAIQSLSGAVLQTNKDKAVSGVDLRASGETWLKVADQLQHLKSLQSLSVAGASVDDGRVTNLCSLTNLRVLKLEQAAITDAVLTVIAKLPKLEELSLERCVIGDAGIENLSASTSLKRLRVPSTAITNQGLKTICSMKQLELLDVTQCSKISSEGLQALVQLDNLKNLSVGGLSVTDQSIASIGQLKKLAALAIQDSPVTDASADVFASLPKLREFNAFKTQLGDGTLDALGSAKELSKVKLRRCAITTNGVASRIEKLSNVVALEISENAIEDEALVAISKMPKLEDLNLLRTKVTDAGVAYLAKVKLKRLNLDDNPGITDVAIETIGRIQSLEFLHVGKTKVTNAGIEKLATLTSLKDLLTNDTAVSSVATESLQKKIPGLKVRN